MKKYIKNTLVEVVSINENGVLIQNEGDSSDQWIVPPETFYKTYSLVNHDKTVKLQLSSLYGKFGEERTKGLNDYCEEAFSNACQKGFHDEYRSFAESIALLHSELSEALEADRKGNEENKKEELADVFIRLADLCGSLDIDLEQEVEKKMEKNRKRPRKHGKRY